MRGNITSTVPNELISSSRDNIVVSADGVYDYLLQEFQEDINLRVNETLENTVSTIDNLEDALDSQGGSLITLNGVKNFIDLTSNKKSYIIRMNCADLEEDENGVQHIELISGQEEYLSKLFQDISIKGIGNVAIFAEDYEVQNYYPLSTIEGDIYIKNGKECITLVFEETQSYASTGKIVYRVILYEDGTAEITGRIISNNVTSQLFNKYIIKGAIYGNNSISINTTQLKDIYEAAFTQNNNLFYFQNTFYSGVNDLFPCVRTYANENSVEFKFFYTNNSFININIVNNNNIYSAYSEIVSEQHNKPFVIKYEDLDGSYDILNDIYNSDNYEESIQYLFEQLEESESSINVVLHLMEYIDEEYYDGNPTYFCTNIENTSDLTFKLYFIDSIGDKYCVTITKLNNNIIANINKDTVISQLQEDINSLLADKITEEYNKITVSISTTPSISYYYKGYGYNNLKLTASVNNATNLVKTLSITGKANGNINDSNTITINNISIPSSATSNYTYTATATFKGKFDGRASKSSSKTITAVGPIFYGYVDYLNIDDLSDSQNLENLVTDLAINSNLYNTPTDTLKGKEFTIFAQENRIWFLVPRNSNQDLEATLTMTGGLGGVPFQSYSVEGSIVNSILSEEYILYISENTYTQIKLKFKS